MSSFSAPSSSTSTFPPFRRLSASVASVPIARLRASVRLTPCVAANCLSALATSGERSALRRTLVGAAMGISSLETLDRIPVLYTYFLRNQVLNAEATRTPSSKKRVSRQGAILPPLSACLLAVKKNVASSGLAMQRGYLSQLRRYAGATRCQAVYETERTPA